MADDRLQTKTNLNNNTHSMGYGSPSLHSGMKANPDVVPLLEAILMEQRRTNEILEQLVNGVRNRKSQQPNAKEEDIGSVDNDCVFNKQMNQKTERPDDNKDLSTKDSLLDVPISSKPTKYAINLAKRRWSEEILKSSIIEPKKPSRKTVIPREQVEEIKSLIFKAYPDMEQSELWQVCRKSINQMGQDMNKKRKT